MRSLPVNTKDVLLCPQCMGPLTFLECEVTCADCKSCYKLTSSGALDLRLQKKKMYQYEFDLGVPLLPESGFHFDLLPLNSKPEVDFYNVDVPHHLSKEIMSYFPRAKTDNSLMLDLGCGSGLHQRVCEHAGFEYVGLDYNSEEAHILGDAHSLPFKDRSFEFILSIAVLEHIQFPFVMMKEAYRVLKPNGIFIGTVAFLEPFHGDSFYHHTHLGTYNSLRQGGFEIEYISPSNKWSVLIAQAHMGLFPRMPRTLSKMLVMPIFLIHKLWWKIGGLINKKATEVKRITHTTGVFTFIARRT